MDRGTVATNQLVQRASGAFEYAHYQKAVGYIKALKDLIRDTTLDPSDLKIAEAQLAQLEAAVQKADAELETAILELEYEDSITQSSATAESLAEMEAELEAGVAALEEDL